MEPAGTPKLARRRSRHSLVVQLTFSVLWGMLFTAAGLVVLLVGALLAGPIGFMAASPVAAVVMTIASWPLYRTCRLVTPEMRRAAQQEHRRRVQACSAQGR